MESAGDVALYAGVTSALQYYALQHNWAVLKISWDDNSVTYKTFLEENYTLDFSGVNTTEKQDRKAGQTEVTLKQMRPSARPGPLEKR
jgi:hypothetical protein